jgi:hypothetical protein
LRNDVANVLMTPIGKMNLVNVLMSRIACREYGNNNYGTKVHSILVYSSK